MDSFVNFFCIFSFIFCVDDVGLMFLFSVFDDEVGMFGVLLGDLFLFDGFGEFVIECYVGDGDVFESDVEFGGMVGKVGLDVLGDSFMLGDEFGGVELGNDGF